jgi:hypothetical protein
MKTCNVVFAGGQCMATMVRAGDQLADLCDREGLRVKIDYLDLWVSDTLRTGASLVVEMFPHFRNAPIPVVSGRAFVIRQGEEELLARLVEMVRQVNLS